MTFNELLSVINLIGFLCGFSYSNKLLGFFIMVINLVPMIMFTIAGVAIWS